jgi:hypothetical protein
VLGSSQDLCAQKDSNYLVFEHVNALVIYNHYEQQLSLSEKAQLSAFAPFRILDESILLSDNFSKAMKIGLEGQIYYFLLNEMGAIKNLSDAKLIIELNKAKEISDSLLVVRDDAVYLSSPDNKSLRQVVSSGKQILRILRYKNRSYGRILDGTTYGWITTAQKDALIRPKQSKSEESGFSSTEIDAIRNKVSHINNQIERLFILFSQQNSNDIKPPRWQITVTSMKIVCFIEKNSPNFVRTGRRLQSEFSSILYRHPISISGQPHHFTIALQSETGS